MGVMSAVVTVLVMRLCIEDEEGLALRGGML